MPENFETFLRIWIAENIYSVSGRQSGYVDHIVRQTADELVDAATVEGFYGELAEAAKPYGGVAGLVRNKFDAASRS
jgi:hypothetical protein